MKIENNCPKCGRLIKIDDETVGGIITCDFCECEINIEYDMIISESGNETEIAVFKEAI